MDLPTDGEKLQHCTHQRPRPNRTNRQPPRKPHVQTSEKSEINENNLYTKVDEGIDEFFSKKLILNYHNKKTDKSGPLYNEPPGGVGRIVVMSDDLAGGAMAALSMGEGRLFRQIPLNISTEPTVLSAGSRTFKKKIGEFFALRKPKHSKDPKSEKDPEGSPVISRIRKPALTDILRPLGKSSDTFKGQGKTDNASSAETTCVNDPTWIPDAARRVKPRYSREGKSQSLILLSVDDEESLGIKDKVNMINGHNLNQTP
ncbi:capping protein, Arp2/3 and myosin-I linker protein 2-like isoform X1 [Pseudophryne corroboree]|uniref:capping protein, Arp2/3 and myosin-I linker protein 2-like isoform X1 n=1 Tax=Pseudophryne corroboree TaxID=495146 RepID=UPI0030814C86